MSKKTNDLNKSKKTATLSSNASELNRVLVVGNYFLARRLAKQILASTTNEADHELAYYALRKTTPDVQALFAGLACLSATILVAWLVAY